MKKTIKMEVMVTVEPPAGVSVSDEKYIELAMSAVTQFHEVDCGPRTGRIHWAKVYAEVSDADCEIVESADA